MTDTRINSIENDLTEAESQLIATLDGLREQVALNEAKLKRVRKALRALTGELATKGRTKKPAANRSDVCTAIASVLEQQEVATEADLKVMAAKHISASGKSLQGFALRFRDALADNERFVNASDGYRLASQEVAPADMAANSVLADIGDSTR